jgi:hypothetical protein
MATVLAERDIPAFPGAQNSFSGRSDVLESVRMKACSLPPEPTTSIFMVISP